MSESEQTRMAREAANAYKRAWAKRNRDKVKAAQARYWLKKYKELAEENSDDGEGTDQSAG